MQLPEEVADEFARTIEALAIEMRDAARAHEDADAPIFSFTYAFVPTDTA